MHFYPHNIADFNNATRHLTRVERSLYRDLIDMYYDTEQPLSAVDFDRLARKVIAISEEERVALRFVLGEFFEIDNDYRTGEPVYRQERCDIEIEKYRANNSAKARAGKASAEARRKKKQSMNERNSTRVKQQLNACDTDEQLTKNQELRTKNQLQSTAMSGKPDDARMILNYLNEKAGKGFKPVPSNITLINARLKEKHSVDEIKAVIDRKVLQWPEGDKMHEYLRPATLFGATNFNQYVGEIGKPLASQGAGKPRGVAASFADTVYTETPIEELEWMKD